MATAKALYSKIASGLNNPELKWLIFALNVLGGCYSADIQRQKEKTVNRKLLRGKNLFILICLA